MHKNANEIRQKVNSKLAEHEIRPLALGSQRIPVKIMTHWHSLLQWTRSRSLVWSEAVPSSHVT